MILADKDIADLCNSTICKILNTGIMIEPFSPGVQGQGVISYGLSHAGYDLRLGYKVKIFKNTFNQLVSPKRFNDDPSYDRKVFETIEGLKNGESVILPPAPSYLLAYSLEYLRIPVWLKGRCVGKSTYARCGIVVNTTPLEPGWEGHLTIEVANTSPCAVELFAGEGIAQLEFEQLTQPPMIDYGGKGGKYQAQKAEPIPARIKE